jgi:hypothetical protein
VKRWQFKLLVTWTARWCRDATAGPHVVFTASLRFAAGGDAWLCLFVCWFELHKKALIRFFNMWIISHVYSHEKRIYSLLTFFVSSCMVLGDGCAHHSWRRTLWLLLDCVHANTFTRKLDSIIHCFEVFWWQLIPPKRALQL